MNFMGLKKMKAILFTDKKKTPALWKVLSKEFKEKLVFGVVRKTEKFVV